MCATCWDTSALFLGAFTGVVFGFLVIFANWLRKRL